MERRGNYLNLILQRGTGTDGGLLDLLNRCGRLGLFDATEDEARRFREDPTSPHTPQPGQNEPSGQAGPGI